MTLSDKLTLYRMAEKYKVGAEARQILAIADRISYADMRTLSGILERLPYSTLSQAHRHPDFPRAIARLVEIAEGSPLRTMAFLKFGIPVRGLVLPLVVRNAIPIDAALNNGTLIAEGKEVDLSGVTIPQYLALLSAARNPQQ